MYTLVDTINVNGKMLTDFSRVKVSILVHTLCVVDRLYIVNRLYIVKSRGLANFFLRGGGERSQNPAFDCFSYIIGLFATAADSL